MCAAANARGAGVREPHKRLEENTVKKYIKTWARLQAGAGLASSEGAILRPSAGTWYAIRNYIYIGVSSPSASLASRPAPTPGGLRHEGEDIMLVFGVNK